MSKILDWVHDVVCGTALLIFGVITLLSAWCFVVDDMRPLVRFIEWLPHV